MNQNFPDLENIVRNEFESFQPDVNPALWDKISASIPTAPAANAAIAKTGMSALTKVIAGAASALIVGTTAYFATYNSQQVVETPQHQVSEQSTKTAPAQSTIAAVKETEPIKVENEVIAATSTAKEKTTEKNNANQSASNVPNVVLNPTSHSTPVPENIHKSNTTFNKENTLPASVFKNEVDTDSEKLNEVVGATVEGKAYPISIITANPAGGYAPLKVSLTSYLNLDDVQWDFGDNETSVANNATHIFEEAGSYTVQLSGKTKDGKQIIEKTTIEVKESLSNLTLPSVFTPNNDNINDSYIADVKGLQSFLMTIYSINGQLVFESNSPETGWDGTMRDGSPAPSGTYMCIVVGSGIDNKLYNSKQTIQLIR